MKSVLLLTATCTLIASTSSVLAKEYYVYFGTYTGAKSKGIYVSRFDAGTGKLSEPELAAETKSPSFLAVDSKERFLYAAGESAQFEGKQAGTVSAFSIDAAKGKLTALNQQPSGGLGPCHVSVDGSDRCVLVANYGSGSVAALPIKEDGKLGEPTSMIQHTGSSVNKERQAGPHGHFITADPDNRFVLACDLGLDKVLIYKLDSKRATLTPNKTPFATVEAGSGPRHLAFNPNGKFVYVINEMASTLSSFSYNAGNAAMMEMQTVSTLPQDFKGKSSTAEVQVHPSGKFVYGSNRGHDSIAVFAADKKAGGLTLVQNESTQGKTPRHFAIDPTGHWLLAENQGSDSVVVFAINEDTGKLKPTGQTVTVGSPVCCVFVPVKK